MSDADLPSEEYERLALEMLAVEAGDVADVKDAMRKIIASAPEGADIAFLLSRALAHAGDRALKRDAPLLLSWEEEGAQRGKGPFPVSSGHHEAPSRWWVAAATTFLPLAAMFWWLGHAVIQTDGGTDVALMAAISMFVIGLGLLGAALIGFKTVLLRGHALSPQAALSSSHVCPPGWYVE
jgi:hypothetical protein